MEKGIQNILFLFICVFMPSFNFAEDKVLLVSGHRGTRGLRPENTLPAFEAAIEAGADILEFDLLLTKDGHLVIYHDEYINPTLVTYLDGSHLTSSPLVHSLTLEQLKQFDCGQKINPLFPRQLLLPGTQIPTLEELFEMIATSKHPQAKKVRLNLELKRDPRVPDISPSPYAFAKAVLDCVTAHRFADRVYYSSFDPESLLALRAQDPDATLAFLKEGDLQFMVEFAQSIHAEIVSPDYALIPDADYIRHLQSKGFKVIPWTVNTPADWETLIDMGADGIITDYPADLIDFLKKKE